MGTNGTLMGGGPVSFDVIHRSMAESLSANKMQNDMHEIAWNLFCELRKELIESQRIRAQIIGFKITFLSAAVGVIVANLDTVPSVVLVIPAFAAVFFDFLITSYSFSIKRSGYYCRTHLEPIFREAFQWPEDFLLWEDFMSGKEAKQNLSFWGNLGLTVLVFIVGCVGLYASTGFSMSAIWRALTALALVVFLGINAWSFYQPRTFSSMPRLNATEYCRIDDEKQGA